MTRAAIVAALMLAALPTAAQSVPGIADDRRMAAAPYYELAACAVKQSRRSAEAVLGEAVGSPQEKRRIDALFNDFGCKEVSNYPDASVNQKAIAVYNRRAFIAEALLASRYPDFATTPAPASVASMPAASTNARESGQVIMRLSACLAKRDWAGVTGLLAAPYGTDAEGKKIAALRPSITACMPDQATSIHPLFLRGALAETVLTALKGAPQQSAMR
ncbi:MAG: hypothetical protein RQ833_03815 [Sphingomonadaceae bacterium]|nr:hypothetical protein [Sphingomonadaceae bacterium]